MLDWLPENVSSFGTDIDWLMRVLYYVTATVFVLVTTCLVIFLVRYRNRPGHHATFVDGHARLELVWTTLTFLTLVIITALSQPIWATIRQRTEPKPAALTARVLAKQFNWIMVYPGPDGRFDTADDVREENELVAPVNQDVHITVLSEDVIHSFFVPQFRLKQDAVPGREIPVWFRATRTGSFEIGCAELCGFGHSTMRGLVRVLSADDYAAWHREHWPETSATEGRQ